jgi:hypothetical protein
MTLINFSNLDFDQIKSSLKEYLRANSNFTDYDFEGSNLSTIIDTLAYNTYITSYNANMVSNEVFIDSATLRENVVSLAKAIGYIPRSRKSSIATVSFFVDTSSLPITPLTLTLQRGLVCTSSTTFQGLSYSFNIIDSVTKPVVNNIVTFDAIQVYEGTYLTQTFTVDTNNPNQKFILSNAGIDVSSIRVAVRNTQNSTVTRQFSLSENLIDIGPTSKVFFIQEIEDQRYEVIFGDGIFGVKLENLNFIEVSYVVSNGENGNGISNFVYAGRLLDNNDASVVESISEITTDIASNNGQDLESVDSIKKFAPRIYASQNRAVTAADYEAIVPMIFPETESISVYGGETLNPPRYGKVFISIKPYNGDFLSSIIKDQIKTQLRKYTVAGIVTEIIDLKYIFVEYESTVYYNANLSPGAGNVKSIVEANLSRYSDSTELNRYGSRFKYSKFQKIIDDSHPSITSNITKITMRRDLSAKVNVLADYELCFGNQFHIKNSRTGYNIKSSGFNVDGIVDQVYFGDLPGSNEKTGSIFLFKLNSLTEPVIVRNNVGSIDYERGEINLSPIKITNTVKMKNGLKIVEISAIPKSNDVIGKEDLYLQLDINNSILNMQIDDISSGANISGSTYTVTSSYTNGSLIRS